MSSSEDTLRQRIVELESMVDHLRGQLAVTEGRLGNAEARAAHEWEAHKKTIAERDSARVEAASWKHRAERHGCDVDNGDPDCA